jgi:hypothetical protein
VGWFKVVGIVCGGLIAAGTVLHYIGALAYGQAAAPIIHKIDAQADTTRRLLWRERADRVKGDEDVTHALEVVNGKLDVLLRRNN